MQTHWLAELDVHIRGSNLREPVLECLDSNEFRVTIAKQAADDHQPLPLEVLPDFIADALASRDYAKAIRLLEDKRARTAPKPDDIYLLTYLYCLNGEVASAETVATLTQDRDRPMAKWLWEKLQAEYRFRPPGSE